MAARRKKDKKLAKKWQKKIKAIRKEAKKLDSDIQDLSDKLVKGNFRIL